MPQNPIIKRRRYLVKKGLQFRYIGLIFILAIIVAVMTGWTVFATGWGMFGEKLANVYPQGRLVEMLKGINVVLIRNLVLVSPFIFLLGILFSHRIAGPLYRIEKTLYEIGRGDLTLKIKLRDGDELSDLAGIVNEMSDKMNQFISSNKKAISEVQKNLDELKQSLASQPCDCSKIEGALDKARSGINQLIDSNNKWST